ncbi:MAG: hypothetical protein JWM96_812 [Alphaproteobacteria bacterium]|nr:hypothetical protein [Alphaproteobacteria bacterium]
MTTNNMTVTSPAAKAAMNKKKQGINWLTGRLSWRVISSVFATIVVVQCMILYFTVQNYKVEQLNELKEIGRSALMPLLKEGKSFDSTDINDLALRRLIRNTVVRGLAFYEPGKAFAKDVYGEPPLLAPDKANPEAELSWLDASHNRFEASFGPVKIDGSDVAVIRMDSSYLQARIMSYIGQTALVSFLLSAFITTVLILVLGKWMIEPILMLRNNLLGAARNPSSPLPYLTRYKRHDELGSVISSANKLIKQNADIMARINRQAQDKIYRVAFYDALTDLPNRVHFINKLDEILQGEDKLRHDRLGVMVIDIDQFGDVNNTLGYEAGDELLKTFGAALLKSLPNALLMARLSEDEFAAIIDLPIDPSDHIRTNVDNVLGVFNNTFSVRGNDLVLEGTVGMALWPNDANRGIDLLKKAESALTQAKLEAKGNFRLYSPSFDQAVQNRIQMVNDLRVAIEEKQFSLVYQPQFDAKTRELIGAEALLRWEKPNAETGLKSFVRPDHFIPVAEQSGLIVPIGRYVIEEACRFAKDCQNEGLKPFRIAINLSGIQFHRDDVIGLVNDVLKKNDLAPHLLELEVTESAVMKDIDQTIHLLTQLKDIGVELAIDDFGTGYSSLSYLKRFPVHRLKVDRSFIMHMTDDPDDAAITNTIIQLGHAIGLKVIAEGVETEAQVDLLTQYGCDEFQGYFFSKPLPPAEFRGFHKGHSAKL